MEGQFRSAQILTEGTQYAYVLGSLSSLEAISVIRAQLLARPEKKNTAIKEALIKAFEESDDEKTQNNFWNEFSSDISRQM